jgi:rhodanese-related sulfurtransferase
MSYSIEKPSNVFQQQCPDDLCIIDVRTAAEVRATSLPGALHLPLQEVTAEAVKQAIQQQGKNPQKIFILCRSGRRAETAAQQLDGHIDQPIVVIEGGIQAVEKLQPEWVLTQGTAVSLERQVRIAAGSLILIGVILGFAVHSAWFALSGFVGAGLLFSGITDSCAMAMILARMPWNK